LQFKHTDIHKSNYYLLIRIKDFAVALLTVKADLFAQMSVLLHPFLYALPTLTLL